MALWINCFHCHAPMSDEDPQAALKPILTTMSMLGHAFTFHQCGKCPAEGMVLEAMRIEMEKSSRNMQKSANEEALF